MLNPALDFVILAGLALGLAPLAFWTATAAQNRHETFEKCDHVLVSHNLRYVRKGKRNLIRAPHGTGVAIAAAFGALFWACVAGAVML